MKKLGVILTTLSIILTLLFSVQAEAKRFGGGKSFGQSYRTAPAQPTQKAAPNNSTQANPAAAQKGSMLKGMLGGLLAGGLLAWLFSNGAFEGLQLMDIILLVGVGFLIFSFLRKMRRSQSSEPAAYGASSNGAFRQSSFETERTTSAHEHSSSHQSLNAEIPFSLPENFDIEQFTSTAREHYALLQKAWDDNDFVVIQEYVSPELFNALKQERLNEGESKTEILFLDAQLVRANQQSQTAELSLLFTGKCKDLMTGEEDLIRDIWHLQRNLQQNNSPWIIVGIQAD